MQKIEIVRKPADVIPPPKLSRIQEKRANEYLYRKEMQQDPPKKRVLSANLNSSVKRMVLTGALSRQQMQPAEELSKNTLESINDQVIAKYA